MSAASASARSSTSTSGSAAEDAAKTVLHPHSSNDISDEFQAPAHLKHHITRHIRLEWNGSLDDMKTYPCSCEDSPATWRVLDPSIFQSTTRYSSKPDLARLEHRAGDVQNCLLIGMKVTDVQSTFPCDVGVQLRGSCLTNKGNYYLDDGHRYHWIVNANERGRVNSNGVVVTSSEYLNSEYLMRYPGMMKQNLRENGIIPVPKEQFTLVAKNHPIAEMMRENAATLQVDLDQAKLIDDRWYKVASPVVDTCLTQLETELDTSLPIIDWTTFEATIERPHGKRWDSPDGMPDLPGDGSLLNKAMEQKRSLRMTLEVTFVYP